MNLPRLFKWDDMSTKTRAYAHIKQFHWHDLLNISNSCSLMFDGKTYQSSLCLYSLILMFLKQPWYLVTCMIKEELMKISRCLSDIVHH